jgi:hypothetical protein
VRHSEATRLGGVADKDERGVQMRAVVFGSQGVGLRPGAVIEGECDKPRASATEQRQTYAASRLTEDGCSRGPEPRAAFELSLDATDNGVGRTSMRAE